MTYIDRITEEVKNELHLKDNRLIQLYAILVLTKGTEITLKDVHDAWAMNMNFKQKTDFCYGHDHKSIVPFEELDICTQNKDARFVDGLRKVAQRVKGE